MSHTANIRQNYSYINFTGFPIKCICLPRSTPDVLYGGEGGGGAGGARLAVLPQQGVHVQRGLVA